jgi:hypothetical protein
MKFNELTPEENDLIESYMLLPLVRKVLENDLRAIEKSMVKFKQPYLDLIHKMLNALSLDLRDVKKELFKKKIKAIKYGDLDYEFIVRGWTYHKVIHPNLASEWVKNKIYHYTNVT